MSLLAINLEVIVATKVIVSPFPHNYVPSLPEPYTILYYGIHPLAVVFIHFTLLPLAKGTNSALNWGPARELLDEATSGEGPLPLSSPVTATGCPGPSPLFPPLQPFPPTAVSLVLPKLYFWLQIFHPGSYSDPLLLVMVYLI